MKRPFDVAALREDFPFFSQSQAPVYFDNAATTQKPRCVLDDMWHFAAYENANIHRGGYPLADRATIRYEQARRNVKAWLHAPDDSEIIFTQNATDALNMAARILSHTVLTKGTNVVVTALEHHSNLLPWIAACEETGAELRIVGLNANAALSLDELWQKVDRRTAVAAITAGANSTGYQTPLTPLVQQLHDAGVTVVLDAAQRIAHEPLSLTNLPCDFLGFSAHKVYASTGLGVLYAKALPAHPRLGANVGGGMVEQLQNKSFTRRTGAQGMEAGTPAVIQAIGLSSAIDYLERYEPSDMMHHEQSLTLQALEGLAQIDGISVVGDYKERLPIIAFTSDRLHPADLAQLLAAAGFAVRAGQHCAGSVHNALGLSASLRLSFGIYNTADEISGFLNTLEAIQHKWKGRR